MELVISAEQNTSDKDIINKKMYEFNAQHFRDELKGRHEEVNLYLKDETGKVWGGILSEIRWNWMEVHYLFIDSKIRQAGYGQKLLSEAERIAIDKNCDFIKLDTLSFQALGFYQKQGYDVFGSIENAGGEYTHYYLKKDLTARS
ncbi:GNAT superfamily N-acetyltransferase [Peribacillus deserti]|uniref:GNAT superfamily N-acetyltransferase n=1 Tax=Peribacillus deserti TaxID=673318 RepID=A0ABS2QGJ1_9BACI|nr:GNAT family N-acetyltransferase [Peribacillus deserti]MBM7691406.1 GNAT superfamily N-acetyltransferase [Peribacillus deserti]